MFRTIEETTRADSLSQRFVVSNKDLESGTCKQASGWHKHNRCTITLLVTFSDSPAHARDPYASANLNSD